jgi:hypothetical protein
MGEPLAGSLFETFVVMEIVKTIAAWNVKPNLYHFRAYSGAEVDFWWALQGFPTPSYKQGAENRFVHQGTSLITSKDDGI